MAKPQFSKDPAEKLDYTIDYSEELTDVADSISSSAWTVESGITNEAIVNTSNTATIWLSGGTDGTTYDITNQITTNTARIYRQKMTIGVKAK